MSTYFLSRVLLFLLINVCAVAVSAQTKFGISFSSDISDEEILQSIPSLLELGIDVFELNEPVSGSLLSNLSDLPIQLLVRSDIEFLTRYEIINSDEIQSDLNSFILQYLGSERVSGLGITSYSDDLTEEVLQNLRNQIPDSLNQNLYQVGTSPSTNISTIIKSSSSTDESLNSNYIFESPFNESDISVLKKSIDNNPDLILMDWYWFNSASSNHSYFLEAISIVEQSSENLFPDDNLDFETQFSQWPVVILVLLWFSIGIHLRSNPTYRPLIFRYFTFHRFFVDDIMRYRERSATPGITLFIQHAYFTGLVVYILSVQFISEKGLEALYYHLPVLAVFGQNYFTIFVLTVIATLAISFLGLIWVYFPNKSMKHFSQVINLYSWIFHLDFVIVSMMLILLITQGSSVAIILLACAHFLCWILAFVLSTYDSSKYLMTGKLAYFMRTVGIGIPLLIALTLLFIFSGYPYDILRLAISL